MAYEYYNPNPVGRNVGDCSVRAVAKALDMDGYSRRPMENSYRRRRDSMGRYSRDGYSGHNDMMPELEELMRNAPDERTRQTVREIMTKMESM